MSLDDSRVGSGANCSSDSQFERDDWKQSAALQTCIVSKDQYEKEEREPSPVKLAAGVVRKG